MSGDEWEWDEDESDWRYDVYSDEWQQAVEDCGQLPRHLGGGCQLAGTEFCDFECPFRDNLYKGIAIDDDDQDD